MESQKPIELFVAAAIVACSNEKQQGVFQCPICQSTAIAVKSSVNGHMLANCPDCKTMIRQ